MLFQALQATSKNFPDKTAILQGSVSITYAELERLCLQFAMELLDRKILPGQPVALILPNEIEFIVAYFSIAAINASVVPLNPELKNEELDFFIKESNAGYIVTNRKLSSRISGFFVAPINNIEVIIIDCMAGLDAVHLGNNNIIGDYPFRTSVAVTDFLYHYSSGTTGLPKRIIRTQINCVSAANNVAAACAINDTDRIFCTIPLFHAHGMSNCMLVAICSGAKLIIMENPQPFILNKQYALEIIEREGVTIFPGIPFQFELLTRVNRKYDLSSIRICFTAGSKLKQETFQEFLNKFGIPIRQVYGSTETGPLCINLDAHPDQTSISVGRPLPGIKIEIWDASGTTLPTGQTGEIAVKSPAMTHGYHHNDELNKSAFRNGYFLPGDIGKLDSDGRLYITGRRRQFIEVVGHKVDPAAIEQLLLTHRSIREAMVVGVKSGDYGREQIKAVIVADKACTQNDILEYCRKHLASFEVPELIELRDTIERDPVGKVKIKVLVD